MSRTRNIKPGFFKNEDLCSLSPYTRLLFAGLWTIADREGRVEDRPKKIKVEVLPYDDCDINELLTSLHESGFVKRYTVGEVRVIQINNWKKHQAPHPKEHPSELPEESVEATEKPGKYGAGNGDSGTSHALPSFPSSSNPSLPSQAKAGSAAARNNIRRFPSKPDDVDASCVEAKVFVDAWKRHKKNRGQETFQSVFQILIGEVTNWGEFADKHTDYCEYWGRAGWKLCGLSLLEWWRNGMPEPPEEQSKSPPSSPKFQALEDWASR